MRNIPKICHFIWTNTSPLSRLQMLSVISFHRYNPDWEIRLHLIKQKPSELGVNTYIPDYTGADYFNEIRELPYVNIAEVDLVSQGIGTDKHAILASDILRVRILYNTGGVYSDFDTLWLKPMSEFMTTYCFGDISDFETTACFYKFTHDHHNNSNIISEPNGEYLLSIIKAQNEIAPPYEDYQTFNTSLLNRKYPTLESIHAVYPRVLAIDYRTFYPYDTFRMKRLFIDNDISPLKYRGAIAIHWFNGNAISKDYINNNGYERDCSMTTILKQEGYL